MLSIITTSHSMECDENEESSENTLVCIATSDAQQTQSLSPTRAGLCHFLLSKVSYAFLPPIIVISLFICVLMNVFILEE